MSGIELSQTDIERIACAVVLRLRGYSDIVAAPTQPGWSLSSLTPEQYQAAVRDPELMRQLSKQHRRKPSRRQ